MEYSSRKEKDAEHDLELDDRSFPSSSDDGNITDDQSTKDSPSSKPSDPPDGGLKAWLQVLGSFFIYFNTWGLVASFGSFQAYYEDELLKDYSPFAISSVGSLQSFLMVFLGCFAGPIFDLGYARQLIWAGPTLIVLGTVAQSFSTNLWQLLLAEGLCVGVGMGCLAVLGVAILSLWWSTKLPVANGIAAAGSGVGGLIYPIMFRSLRPIIGFGWTIRAISLLVLITLGVSVACIHTPKASPQRRAWIDRSAFRDPKYLIFVGACCLVFLGIYTPFVYIQDYTLDNSIASPQVATYLLSLMNGSSIFGRIIPNLFAQQVGGMNMLVFAVLIQSIAAYFLMTVRNTAGLVMVVIFYGFSSGSFFSLQPTTFGRLTANRAYIGTRLGMAYSVMSIALLLGSPIGGAFTAQAI
ncbi:hypothetical protein EsH8_V_000722 [Colletotrichum jinshuiense]